MIYLAGSCSSEQRTLMQKIAKTLRENGWEVYCPFEMKIPNAWDMSQEDWAEKVFEKDKEYLDKADVFLMISPGRFSSAGTNFEQGYMYALGKRIIVMQFTDAHTSLMTFCGSTIFMNTTQEHITEDILKALGMTEKPTVCKTTLT